MGEGLLFYGPVMARQHAVGGLGNPTDNGWHCDFVGCEDEVRMRVIVVSPWVIRVRFDTRAVIESWPSYAVDPRLKVATQHPELTEIGAMTEIRTGKLTIRIDRRRLKIEFLRSADNELLLQDHEGFKHTINCWNGGEMNWVTKKIRPEEHFYGLGDKAGALNLRGRRLEMWGCDSYCFTDESDPLYKSIPFFIGQTERASYGILYDNTGRSFFDFGADEENVLKFGSECGLMDYYFIGGESPVDIISRYTRLTGLPPMPPMWALGYHQSRWSYYPDNVVKYIADRLRREKIPCDAIHLDIHHLDDFKSLTWNHFGFPDPKGLADSLEKQGIKLVSIVNPGVKIEEDSPLWQEGFKNSCYCRRQDGFLLQAKAWPGLCHFPDFTDPYVRDWWAKLFQQEVGDIGIRGIWTDMNEPTIVPDTTFPLDTRHVYDGRPCSHKKAHNVYGHCMVMATDAGMRLAAPQRRPFILTRAGFAGLQRYAATWTGDNVSTWEHLRLANSQCQRLATSGISFAGSDVGGFMETPSPELFCRWMQLATFHCFFRNHCTGEAESQEPWCFGEEVLQYVRASIETRYRLLPYFYTQFYRYSNEGIPVIRSLAIQNSDLKDTHWRNGEFFVGDDFYVVPVLHPEVSSIRFFVPPGVWYDYGSDELLVADSDSQECEQVCSLERIPVFVRGGAVIPHWPVQQFVGELADPPISLHLWWTPRSRVVSYLYGDDGDGFQYLEGTYSFDTFEYESSDNGFDLRCKNEGSWSGRNKKETLAIHAIPEGKRCVISIDDRQSSVSQVDRLANVALPPAFRLISVKFL